MSGEKILAVDDESDILELIQYNLSAEGYEVFCAMDGESAIHAATEKSPDLILLDWMLPGMSGLEITKRLKSNPKTAQIPIIMQTVKNSETDIALGLEMGADDYITKPFSPRVMVARVRAVLRRSAPAHVSSGGDSIIKAGDLLIHPGHHEVLLKGKQIDLTYTEFRILQTLTSRPGWVFTRNQIVDAIRGSDYAVTDRSIDVHIASLRHKLGSGGTMIKTVRGVGYKFES
jgi:two-component system phosphate regulon response regulator PhoB